MTSTTKTIFERFEIRKTKKQKTAFLQWAQPQFQQMGYGVRVEEGSLGVRNLVVGDVDRAKVIFTAHYDTCARMPVPNLITPACISGFVAYQLVMLLLIFGLAFAMMFAAGCLHPSLIMPAYYISIFGLLALMLFGPANRHTANDNTSGVTAIMDLAQAMPEELRGRAAFVLFDLEEMGLIGSSSFAKRHKAHLQQTPVINLDCISDGETLFLGLKKGSRHLLPKLEQAYTSDSRMTTRIFSKHYVYPSDQANFRCGVGVAALKKGWNGILYMDRIHTCRDTVYRQENIAFVVEGSIRLTESL